jgi:hypothetical protein
MFATARRKQIRALEPPMAEHHHTIRAEEGQGRRGRRMCAGYVVHKTAAIILFCSIRSLLLHRHKLSLSSIKVTKSPISSIVMAFPLYSTSPSNDLDLLNWSVNTNSLGAADATNKATLSIFTIEDWTSPFLQDVEDFTQYHFEGVHRSMSKW